MKYVIENNKLTKKIDEAVSPMMKEEIRNAKKVFAELRKMYSKIPKFPLKFKNLKGRGGGYLEISRRTNSKKITVKKMVIDNSGTAPFEADYNVCHEFAHAILAVTEGNAGHGKKHDKLTRKLTKKFGIV